MPYVIVSRVGAAATIIYLPWSQVMDAGIQELAVQALAEPGVSTVELVDDARSRVLVVEARRAGLSVTPQAG